MNDGKREKSTSPEPSGSRDCKRARILEKETQEESRSSGSNILDFSDDVLLHIMKFLRPPDLMALSRCCKRLGEVCRDRTLWRTMDFRCTVTATEDLEKYAKCLQPTTTQVALRGTLSSEAMFKRDFITAVGDTCKNLKEFILEEFNIDAQEIPIWNFPQSIEILSLKGCALHNLNANSSYLYKINHQMLNLTCLILSHCSWVTSHSLLVISKIPNLKELRLNSCRRLTECVAYTSLATRFGFKKLEILDVRDTDLGDSEICCFNTTKTLTHVYLECPLKSRIRLGQRRRRRIEEIMQGQQAYQDMHLVEYVVENDRYDLEDRQCCLITDRAVCALGTRLRHRRIIVNPRGVLHYPLDVMFEEDIWASNHPNLKTLVVRYYSHVTNQSLVQLSANANSLEFLDVTGTSVTKVGMSAFKKARPNVTLVSSFDE